MTGYRPPEHGPFRHLRRPPAEVRDELAGDPVLAYVTSAPLHGHQIGQLRHAAGQLKARLLLLPMVAGPAEVVGRPDALVRTVQAAARHLPPGTQVIPVPLRPYPRRAGMSWPCGRSSRPRTGRRICWPRSRWSPPACRAAGAMAAPARLRSSR